MAQLTFYYGSGSPFAWRVFLALEHKGISYQLKTLSFSAGEHRRPEYLALNPRHKVPTIVDGEFVLYESAAILEYLEEAYPTGPKLFPGDIQQRAIARRIICEADSYLWPNTFDMVSQIFFKAKEDWHESRIARGRAGVLEELSQFDARLNGDFFLGDPGAVDFTIYPFLASHPRLEMRMPELKLTAHWPAKTAGWVKRMEALPFFERTYPPHWRK